MASEPLYETYEITENVYDQNKMDQESEGIRENPSQLNQNLNQIIEFNTNTGTECYSKDARERDSLNIDPDQTKIDELIANTNEINLCAQCE